MAKVDPCVHLVKGDDPSLTAAGAKAVVDVLVGSRDRTLAIETAPDDASGEQIVGLVAAAPLFTDRRIVVVRDAGRLSAADVAPLLRLLDEPPPTGFLVLVAGGGTIPKKLVDAVKARGVIHDRSPGRIQRPDDKSRWINEQAAQRGVALTAKAARTLAETLGEDLGRLPETLAVLAEVGAGRTLDAADVEPYVGTAGGVPVWELTGAIESGDAASALATLRRLFEADRHPFVVFAALANHVHKVATLHGSSARTEQQAADLLGLRGSTFPARKALNDARSLSAAQVRRCIEWIAEADLDLRGMTDNPAEVVLEILVARLARVRPQGSSRRRAAS